MKYFRVIVFAFLVSFLVSIPVLSEVLDKGSNLNSSSQENSSEDDFFKKLGVRKMVNEQAPSFVLKDIDGTEVSLDSFKGKTVFIDFWATWCGPCKKEMPHIEKLAQEFQKQGLVILTISNENKDTITQFLSDNKYKIRSLIDEGKEVAKKYQVKGLPTAFIIDKEGKIVTHFIGSRDEASLRNELKKAGIVGS